MQMAIFGLQSAYELSVIAGSACSPVAPRAKSGPDILVSNGAKVLHLAFPSDLEENWPRPSGRGSSEPSFFLQLKYKSL